MAKILAHKKNRRVHNTTRKAMTHVTASNALNQQHQTARHKANLQSEVEIARLMRKEAVDEASNSKGTQMPGGSVNSPPSLFGRGYHL